MAASAVLARRSVILASVAANWAWALPRVDSAAFSACWAWSVLALWTATPASSALTAFSRSSSLALSVSSCAAAWAFLAEVAAFLSSVASAKAGVAMANTITTTSKRAAILSLGIQTVGSPTRHGCKSRGHANDESTPLQGSADGPEEPLDHPHFPEGVTSPPLGPVRSVLRLVRQRKGTHEMSSKRENTRRLPPCIPLAPSGPAPG